MFDLDPNVFDQPDFKTAFWNWFDNELAPQERRKFQEHHSDLAELNFYNRYWVNS